MILYLYDQNTKEFTGTVDYEPGSGPRPKNSTAQPPPDFAPPAVAKWHGGRWRPSTPFLSEDRHPEHVAKAKGDRSKKILEEVSKRVAVYDDEVQELIELVSLQRATKKDLNDVYRKRQAIRDAGRSQIGLIESMDSVSQIKQHKVELPE